MSASRTQSHEMDACCIGRSIRGPKKSLVRARHRPQVSMHRRITCVKQNLPGPSGAGGMTPHMQKMEPIRGRFVRQSGAVFAPHSGGPPARWKPSGATAGKNRGWAGEMVVGGRWGESAAASAALARPANDARARGAEFPGAAVDRAQILPGANLDVRPIAVLGDLVVGGLRIRARLLPSASR